jgi:hypothetical protein
MEYEIISILTNKAGLADILNLVKSIQEKNPELGIGTPRYGQLSDKMIVSYRVPKPQAKRIAELFSFKNIQMTGKDENILSIINSVKNAQQGSKIPGVEGRRVAIGAGELDELVKKGYYQEVLKISKDISSFGHEISNQAKALLTDAIQAAIDVAHHNGFSFQSKAEDSIDNLAKIACDQNLKNLNKADLMRLAGTEAINLCIKYPKHLDKLILICNNSGMPQFINLKAAAVFSEIVFGDEVKYKIDIAIAVRDLNTKWLAIAYDMAGQLLNSNENEAFKKLTSFINRNR